MNPHFHMKPEMSSLRVYSAPNGYEERRPYDGIIMVNHLTDTSFICTAQSVRLIVARTPWL
jgi:hypothetical protein